MNLVLVSGRENYNRSLKDFLKTLGYIPLSPSQGSMYWECTYEKRNENVIQRLTLRIDKEAKIRLELFPSVYLSRNGQRGVGVKLLAEETAATSFSIRHNPKSMGDPYPRPKEVEVPVSTMKEFYSTLEKLLEEGTFHSV